MKRHDLRWLADELGMPVFEETAAGLCANPAGEAALAAEAPGAAQPAPTGVIAAAAAVMGVSPDAAELREAEAHARGGARHATVLVGAARGRSWRIIAAPVAPDGMRAAGAPDGTRILVALAPVWADASARERMVDVAAAVSHEVANAVGAIRGWADLALSHGEGGASPVPARDALTLIAGAARSAEHAARGMLTLARASAHDEPTPRLDLSEFASELLHLLTLTAREARVTLESSIAPQLFVQASRAQAFTILFNLVKNAIEACGAGGKVSVRATAEDQLVVLTVRDDGEGLAPETQKRLFEPYYTTKATGTGLGLSLVLDAVRASGSALEVESEPGRGTSFQVSLPRVLAPLDHDDRREDAGSRVNLKPIAPADAPLDARILVVDDDRALREMLATALGLRGAEVTSVASGAEALALEDTFDIALVDVLLEGSRGDELLAQLRQRGVVSAAMLVTGTVQRPRPVAGGEPDDWVRKPFEIPQLVERIRHVLAGAQARLRAGGGARA
ncbi:MAG: ATP-binding protein [Polyangiales bacterium]